MIAGRLHVLPTGSFLGEADKCLQLFAADGLSVVLADAAAVGSDVVQGHRAVFKNN